MTEANSSSTSDTASGAAEKKEGLWHTVLTSTPVILTVLATLLAGQSSTQMSLAQYHRALAAQHQTKAADQWSFFQAKRIRGENFEATRDLTGLFGDSGRIQPTRLIDRANRLLESIRRAERDTRQAIEALGRTNDESGPAASTVLVPLHRLLEAVHLEATHTEDTVRELREFLLAPTGDVKPELAAALRYLDPPHPNFHDGEFDDAELQRALVSVRSRREPPQHEPAGVFGDAAVYGFVKRIRQRETGTARGAAVAEIDDQTLEAVIRTVAADSSAFDEWGDATARTIDELSGLVKPLSDSVSTLRRAAAEVESVLDTEPASDEKMRRAIESIARSVHSAGRLIDPISRDSLAGRHGFIAWRYEVEARYNQSLGELYEVKVERVNAVASGHLKRCWGYFYAQLAVQAAVTIATLALAVRQRSVLWSLACVASAFALFYAAGVLLDAAPVPGV